MNRLPKPTWHVARTLIGIVLVDSIHSAAARDPPSNCYFEGYNFVEEFGETTYKLDDTSQSGWNVDFTPCNNGQCERITGMAIKAVATFCSGSIADYDNSGQWSWINGHNREEGIQAQYSNGSPCTGGQPHTATINFVCREQAQEVTARSTDIGACDWVFTVPSEVMCTEPRGGLSAGWVFTIIVLTSITAYFLFGCLYMWRARGTALGVESTPHREFWAEIPSLVKDGCRFTYEKIRGEKYSTLSSGNDYEETF